MDKRKTHFEQVPLKIAEKIAEKEIGRKEKSPVNRGSKPKTAVVPVEATIAVGAGGLNS
jgi:hypothetical protein